MWSPQNWAWMQQNVPILCVDGVVMNDSGQVLLTQRQTKPFQGYWHLPGGVVDFGETLEQAIKRIVQRETGLQVKVRQQIGIFDDPLRDPRGHFVTVAFLLAATSGSLTNANPAETQAAAYFDLEALPKNMGFDARKIVESAQKNGSSKRT